MAFATFGGGCFWGVEAAFRGVPGVINTCVGYAGGTVEHPTYEQVCTGTTGHAEVVEVEYDPARVSYDELIEVFWDCHNPTQLHRQVLQGNYVPSQYRSVLFYHDHQQEKAARSSEKRLAESGRFHSTIVTRIEPVAPFWKAEEYHQRYLEKKGLAHCGAAQ